MIRTFPNPASFARHLLNVAVSEALVVQEGLEACAKLIENSAKEEIGHLQPAVGPFAAWAPLADSTIADKARQGYLFNDEGNPLLRRGDLRDSISHDVEPLSAVIGSTSQIMVYQEYGTIHIPARSVIGAAGYKNKEKIIAILTLALASGFSGASMVLPFLGATISTEL